LILKFLRWCCYWF